MHASRSTAAITASEDAVSGKILNQNSLAAIIMTFLIDTKKLLVGMRPGSYDSLAFTSAIIEHPQNNPLGGF